MWLKRAVLAVFIFLTSGISAAYADKNLFYGGDFVCNGAVIFSEWHIVKSGGNNYEATIFQGRRDQNNFTKYELSGSVFDGKLHLFEGNKPFLDVDIPGGDILNVNMLSSAWHPFSSLNKCPRFSIGKTTSAKTRWKRAIDLLKVENPTVSDADEIAYFGRNLPPVAMLPVSDQQKFENEYNDRMYPFWASFYKAETERLNMWPIATFDERLSLISEMRAATAFDLSPEGTLATNIEARKHAIDFLGIVSERLSGTNTPVPPFDEIGLSRCQRLGSIHNPDSASIGLLVGLPIDYWSKELYSNVVSQARTCSMSDSFMVEVSEAFSGIERIRANQMRRIDEAFKGMNGSFKKINEAKNACVAAFYTAKTSGLKNSQLFIKECDARAEALAFEHEKTLVELQIAKILNAPKTLDGLKENNWFSLDVNAEEDWEPSDKVIADFEERTQDALKEALKAAVEAIDQTLTSDDLEEIKTTNIVEYCEEFISSDDIPEPITVACEKGLKSLDTRREEAECKLAVKLSKVEEKFLNGSVNEDNQNIAIKDIICGAARDGHKVTIDTTGFSLWKKDILSVEMENEATTRFYLTETEVPTVWKAEAADGQTKVKNGYFACLASPDKC